MLSALSINPGIMKTLASTIPTFLTLLLTFLILSSCAKEEEEPCDDCIWRMDYFLFESIELGPKLKNRPFYIIDFTLFVDGDNYGWGDFEDETDIEKIERLFPDNGCFPCVPARDKMAVTIDWCEVSSNPKLELRYSVMNFDEEGISFKQSEVIPTATTFFPQEEKKYHEVIFEGEHATFKVDLGFRNTSISKNCGR